LFRICGLFRRHAVTSSYIIRYDVFSGRADYSVDMRNIFDSLALWQIQYSDYSVGMRKSIPEQAMWPSDLFGFTAAACAPSNVISRSSQSRLSRRKRRHTDATSVDPVTPIQRAVRSQAHLHAERRAVLVRVLDRVCRPMRAGATALRAGRRPALARSWPRPALADGIILCAFSELSLARAVDRGTMGESETRKRWNIRKRSDRASASFRGRGFRTGS
jgi:hypothetical protein